MGEERKIQLVAEVDATGTRAGFNEIQREAGTMAASVQRSSQQAERAVAGVGGGAATSARNIEAAQRNLIGSIQRSTAAMEAGSRSGSAYYEVLARQRGVDPTILEPYLVQLRAIETAQARASAANLRGSASLNEVGASAAQTSAALRNVPAQFTDIITSLQGGQAPLTVLLQQGGQLSDMFGGAANAARALGGYVRSLVTPYTVATAAAVGLAVAYHTGSKEADAYARSIELSGNAAGGTIDQLSQMAREIGRVSGSQGDAASAVAAIAGTGQVSVDNLQRFALAAVEAQKIIGRSVDDTVADFAALKEAPLSALEKINDKYHFITAATYAQVKALQDQGRASEAATVAQNAYADAVLNQKDKVMASLSDWERGWIRIKNGISGAVDSIFDLGRGATNFEKIGSLLKQRDSIEANMARAREMRDTKAEAAWKAQLDRNGQEISNLRNKADAEKAAAKAAADAADVAEAKNKWLVEGDKYLSRAAQMEREVTKARNEGAAAQLSSVEIEKRVGDIRKKYSDIFNDGIDSSIEKIRRRAAIEDVLTQRSLARISAGKAAGETSEEDAINATAAAELAAFDQKRKQLEQELVLVRGKQNSAREQEEINTDIAVIAEQRESRRLELGQELFALEQRRTRQAADNYANVIDRALSERDGLVAQVKAQRDYNETIGLTAFEILNLNGARAEALAIRKDEDAANADSLDESGMLAASYREQAMAIRDRSAAEKAGFIKERDPWVNLRLSVKRYGDEASNVGAQIGDAMTRGINNAEDAFVSFVATGKISFSSLAASILTDIARIEAKRAVAGFVNIALNAFAPSTGAGTTGWDGYGNTLAGARAGGGPVTGGLSYLVGEKGPEIFTPSGSGAIIPNNQLGGATQISIATYITDGGARTETSAGSGAQAREIADGLNAKMKAVIMQEMRQGGILWNQQMRGMA